ncbi:hypothetical protein DM01DRAFT_1331583, partial [Hesseltinella vesiculosa]
MLVSSLPNELILSIVQLVDQETKNTCTRLCRSLYPLVNELLWAHATLSCRDQVERLFQAMPDTSAPSSASGSPISFTSQPRSKPYHLITHLTIHFAHFDPYPFHDLLPYFAERLGNLVSLHMTNTFALFLPTLLHCHWHQCVFTLPSTAEQDAWFDFFFSAHRPLPLTHLTILNATIQDSYQTLLVDEHLQAIASSCFQLESLVCNGFFTDMGIIPLAARSPRLRSIELLLPHIIRQSNTISQAALEQLAQSCPELRQVICLGQTRIHPDRALALFQHKCPYFTSGDFSI